MIKSMNIFLALAAVFTAAFTQSAHAYQTPSHTVVFLAQVLSANMDHHITTLPITGGEVTLDYTKNTLSVGLDSAPKCEEGFACPQFMINALSVELPIVEKHVTDCGSTVIVAQKDLRPVDGALSKLVLTDNTTNHCPTFVALPATHVQYTTQAYDMRNDQNITTHSDIIADRLLPAAVPM